jgi:ParB family chromosome partitioning protein
MPDAYKNRVTRLPVQDPAKSIQQHGVHGDRVPSSSRRIIMIPIEKIRPGRYQKRESVDPEKYQQLKDQVRDLGLNFVAILCVDPDDDNFYNLIMGGHLRIQAAGELGITEVPAIIREYNRLELGKGTYFENNGRQPLTLIEEGLIFKQFKDDEGWTQEEIAKNLIVPGGRSHVALCMLTVTAPPDIQEMLRQDPKRGNRCFTYLKQLDILGEERAIELRRPIIYDFLLGKLSTDEVQVMVKQILAREQGELSEDDESASLPIVRRQNKIASTIKSFRRFEKEIGDAVPSVVERDALLRLKTKVEDILKR